MMTSEDFIVKSNNFVRSQQARINELRKEVDEVRHANELLTEENRKLRKMVHERKDDSELRDQFQRYTDKVNNRLDNLEIQVKFLRNRIDDIEGAMTK